MPINRQLVFDKTVERAKDPRHATNGPASGGLAQCMCRAPDGSVCFFGALVPDHLYSSAMEGHAVRHSEAQYLAAGLFINSVRDNVFTEDDLDFLKELQSIHDLHALTDWKRLLLRRAADYDLNNAEALKLP